MLKPLATTTTSDARSAPVTVLGLGEMGSAIARVFLDNGHPTTVWNRTASKTARLVEAGASAAGTEQHHASWATTRRWRWDTGRDESLLAAAVGA